MRKAVYICLSFIFIGCSPNPVPKEILSPEKMEKVVYDLMQVDEYINNFVVKDSSVDIKKKRSIFYEQVFKLHNTNRKEFYTSYKYYQQHPDIQKVLFDSLYAKAGRRKTLPARTIPIKPFQVK
ncbi:MAG: DUF4296 domain-containing protein [Segetibacter sp.]